MPKITIVRPERDAISPDELGSYMGTPPGSVVCSSTGISVGGPFLVCIEHNSEPLKRSGCPNGQTRPFLVHMEDGYRYNISDFHKDTKFYAVKCKMVVED